MSWQPSLLRNSILATITYFSNVNYPLTLIELYQNLIINIDNSLKEENPTELNLNDLKKFLDQDEYLASKINQQNGFYFLATKTELTKHRQESFAISRNLYNKALRTSWVLSYFPFIKMIAICNTLAYNNVNPKSDIDLFIITSANRIWTTRALTVIFLDIFRLRPKPNNCQGKICLSFFITEKNLNLQETLIKPYDIYYYYWLAKLVIIYDQLALSEKFYQANNWLLKYLPNFKAHQTHHCRRIKNNSIIKKLGENILNSKFGNKLETWLKAKQMARLPASTKEMANKDSRVIINDNILKFHGLHDKRDTIRQTFETNYNRIKYD